MPSPFPGMDPYLEQPALWPDVHNALISELRNHLAPMLEPRYYVGIEERVYLTEAGGGREAAGRADVAVATREGPSRRPRRAASPDAEGESVALVVSVPTSDELCEAWLEVRESGSGRVVTVVELLSPANKRWGGGREMYEEKRRRVLSSLTSLVEVDLLRGEAPMTVFGADRRSDYRILVAHGEKRPNASLHVFSVREPIPRFRLPLLRGDAEPEVDLGALLAALYDKARYRLRIDYRDEPAPPLRRRADRAWAEAILRRTGKRK